MSLLAKVEYLVNVLKIAPPQILVISFTKKTVAELIERCAINDVEIQTFHGLGNKILKTTATAEQGMRRLVDDDKFAKYLREKIILRCNKDEKFARVFNDFVLFYFSCPHSPGAANSFSGKIMFNRSYLGAALLRSHAICNKDEQLIANLLTIHGIDYDYRKQYRHAKTHYCPSFSFGDRYIDTVDVLKNGKSFRGRQYLNEIEYRRALHAKNRTEYFEAKSYY